MQGLADSLQRHRGRRDGLRPLAQEDDDQRRDRSDGEREEEVVGGVHDVNEVSGVNEVTHAAGFMGPAAWRRMAALQIPVIEADAMLEGEAFEVVDGSAQEVVTREAGDLVDPG